MDNESVLWLRRVVMYGKSFKTMKELRIMKADEGIA